MTKVAVVIYDIDMETSLGADKGYEPIGAMIIVGSLLRAGVEAQLFARSLYRSLDELAIAVIDWKPKYVGFSTMYCNIRQSIKLAELFESEIGARTIFGGWHTSGIIWHYLQGHPYPDLWEFLNQPGNDEDPPWRYGIYGEGLRSMPELVLALEAGTDPMAIPGVCCMGNNEKLIANPPYPRISPDEWPKVPYDQYPLTNGRRTIITGQGCRNACRYCQTPVLYKGCQRLHPAKAAARVARMINEDPEIHILWDTNEDFTGDREWLEAFCRELTRIGVDRRVLNTFGNGRDFYDIRTRQTVNALAEAGWDTLLIGIETPNQEILRNMNRARETSNVRNLFCQAKESGIKTIGSLMIGYPEQDERSLMRSLWEVEDQYPMDHIYISFLMPMPGTMLYHDCRQKGLIRDEVPPEQWTGIEPIIKTSMAPETLRSIRMRSILMYASKILRM